MIPAVKAGSIRAIKGVSLIAILWIHVAVAAAIVSWSFEMTWSLWLGFSTMVMGVLVCVISGIYFCALLYPSDETAPSSTLPGGM